MFTPTLRCECAQPVSDQLMRKWCINPKNVSKVLARVNLVPGKFKDKSKQASG